MPWQKKGRMKYELVEALPENSSPAKGGQEFGGKKLSHSPSSSVDTATSSYATSLWSHFANDPVRGDQRMEDSNENLEPNVTRRFVVGIVASADTLPATPKPFQHARIVAGKDEELDESESLSSPESASNSGRELREISSCPIDSVEDYEALDEIVEVGSITPASMPVDPSDRRIRHLLKVMKSTIVSYEEEGVAKNLRKLADSCLEKACPHRSCLVDHGAVDWIATAIQRFPGSSIVASRGLRALQNVTCGSVLAREMLQRLNGSHLICQAMGAFANDAKVQRDGCGALLNFLLRDLDSSRSESFISSGGLETILMAMEGHPSDLKLCEWACRCIQALCKTCKHYRPEVWSKGGFTAILNAREHHPKCRGIQKAARSATRMFWTEYETSMKRV